MARLGKRGVLQPERLFEQERSNLQDQKETDPLLVAWITDGSIIQFT
jgi:hypothetical protein